MTKGPVIPVTAEVAENAVISKHSVISVTPEATKKALIAQHSIVSVLVVIAEDVGIVPGFLTPTKGHDNFVICSLD